MPTATFRAPPILTPRDAIATHVRWKITLSMAAAVQEPLSARATYSIQHLEECSVGRWLLSQHTLHLRQTPEYLAVVDLHKAFHREMIKIANFINAGDFAAAERLLNSPQNFQAASNNVANAIMALDRIYASKIAP